MVNVLIDLSLGLLGHGGIQQDSRLLWKTLNSVDELNAIGLINAMDRKILSKPNSKSEASVTLAEILNKFPNSGFPFLQKKLEKIKFFSQLVFPNDENLYDLPTENNFAIWDSIFKYSLASADIDSVLESEFKIARVSHWQKHLKNSLPGQSVRMNTKGYEFAIFQTETYVKVSPKTKKIIRFHDAIPLRNPHFFESSASTKLQSKNIKSSARDGYFVCNSTESRRQLIEYFPELELKSEVIPYSLSQNYWQEINRSYVANIVNRRRVQSLGIESNWRMNERYIISVSTLEPRKNFPKLIYAWEGLGKNAPKLVIVANKGWKSDESIKAMEPHIKNGNLVHLSGLTSEELRLVYSSSIGMAFVSLDEGFGFTPMEAMMCKVPTLVSNIPAHREVMADGSIYCDPNSVQDIREGLSQLISLGRVKSELINRGTRRISHFTHEKSVERWANLFRNLQNNA